jgi:hypothetical protein
VIVVSDDDELLAAIESVRSTLLVAFQEVSAGDRYEALDLLSDARRALEGVHFAEFARWLKAHPGANLSIAEHEESRALIGKSIGRG